MYKYFLKHHPKEDCKFKLKVVKKFKDALSRQADESVRIQNLKGLSMNYKSEFFAPPIKRITLTDAHTNHTITSSHIKNHGSGVQS